MKKLLAILTLVFVTACSVELPKPAGKFVDVDDLQIHYTRAGSGERNVVLVHGFGSGSFTWEGIQERVPEGYTAWALGDLDCDGTYASFKRMGVGNARGPNNTLDCRVSQPWGVYVENETE